MTGRNENLLKIAAVLLLALFGWLLFRVFTDPRPGVSAMDASLKERVSYYYLLKSAADPASAGTVQVEPGRSGYENGAANIVTAVVVDYRALDTLGEVLVLFAATAGVGLLMKPRKQGEKTRASLIVSTAIPPIMLFTVVTGLYVIFHGHLTPGGGFPGGAIIASAFILRSLAFGGSSGKKSFPVLESLAGLGILAMGVAGLVLEGSFLANFLPAGPVGGLFSALGILILYTLIGIKVAAELSNLSGYFIGDSK